MPAEKLYRDNHKSFNKKGPVILERDLLSVLLRPISPKRFSRKVTVSRWTRLWIAAVGVPKEPKGGPARLTN